MHASLLLFLFAFNMSCWGHEGKEAETFRRKTAGKTSLPKSTCFAVPYRHMALSGEYGKVAERSGESQPCYAAVL